MGNKLKIFILLALSFQASFFGKSAYANVTPPAFPSCNPKIFEENGDWAHYDFGSHEILGVGRQDGRDDVYTLNDGNFLQCFCPVEGNDGIQTNWWNIAGAGLTEEEAQSFVNLGWSKEDGGSWNLYHETYLAKNTDFSCEKATPAPSPTSTPTPTPTHGPEGPLSRCFDLEAEPSEGTAPLTVKFTGHADDPATGGKIKEYRFDFADASGGQPQIQFQSGSIAFHRYELPGTYEAKLRIQDNAGNWRESDDCKATITVHSQPQVLGAEVPEALPAAGADILAAAFLLPIGVHLYKRFKINL